MLGSLLVAVDGSENANKALEFAANLAVRFDADLTVICVYKHYSPMESSLSMVRTRDAPEAPDQALSKMAREVVEQAVARARALGAPRVEGVVRRGGPARMIVEEAQKRAAEAIVIGSRGLGDVSGFLLGSVSHKVASLAPCTCITVK